MIKENITKKQIAFIYYKMNTSLIVQVVYFMI